MSIDKPVTIECSSHGTGTACVVCGHLLRATDISLGFIENSTDPDDLQAWCDACEQMFLREQGMTDAFREFNDMTVVCARCYVRLKALHSTQEQK